MTGHFIALDREALSFLAILQSWDYSGGKRLRISGGD
jgi:hypothetical protein